MYLCIVALLCLSSKAYNVYIYLDFGRGRKAKPVSGFVLFYFIFYNCFILIFLNVCF